MRRIATLVLMAWMLGALGACSFAKRVPLSQQEIGMDEDIQAPYEIVLHSGVEIKADAIETEAEIANDFEFVFDDHLRLRVPKGFEPAELSRLLEVVRRTC